VSRVDIVLPRRCPLSLNCGDRQGDAGKRVNFGSESSVSTGGMHSQPGDGKGEGTCRLRVKWGNEKRKGDAGCTVEKGGALQAGKQRKRGGEGEQKSKA